MPINSFLYPGAKFVPPYEVANSLRVDRNSGDYLTRNETQAQSDGKKITISIWFKVGAQLGSTRYFFGGHADGSYTNEIGITANDQLNFSCIANGTNQVTTNRVFRDPSAWYHVVAVLDSTQGTSTNRIKLYINGVEETSFASSSYPSENAVTEYLKNGGVTRVGDKGSGGNNWDGYLAEIFVLDGQALTPTSFGEFDSDTNIWKPIDCKDDLTFGNNGFYLDFKDSNNLGNDASSNANDFSANNIDATNQSTDTCTNNFATLNPLTNEDTDITLSQGNLDYTNSGSGDETVFASIGVSSGKWYFETKWTDTSNYMDIGVGSADEGDIGSPRADAEGTGYYMIQLRTSSPGTRAFNNGSAGSGLGNSALNDINMFAIDMDNNKFYAGKNGTWYSSGDPANDSNPLITMDDGFTTLIPIVCGKSSSAVSVNFGSPSYSISSGNSDANGYGNFEYSVPSGFYAINSKNLAEFG